MPYGLSKKSGGDTPDAEAWMARCIKDVQAKGNSKLSAVLICKAQYQKTHRKGRK